MHATTTKYTIINKKRKDNVSKKCTVQTVRVLWAIVLVDVPPVDGFVDRFGAGRNNVNDVERLVPPWPWHRVGFSYLFKVNGVLARFDRLCCGCTSSCGDVVVCVVASFLLGCFIRTTVTCCDIRMRLWRQSTPYNAASCVGLLVLCFFTGSPRLHQLLWKDFG